MEWRQEPAAHNQAGTPKILTRKQAEQRSMVAARSLFSTSRDYISLFHRLWRGFTSPRKAAQINGGWPRDWSWERGVGEVAAPLGFKGAGFCTTMLSQVDPEARRANYATVQSSGEPALLRKLNTSANDCPRANCGLSIEPGLLPSNVVSLRVSAPTLFSSRFAGYRW